MGVWLGGGGRRGSPPLESGLVILNIVKVADLDLWGPWEVQNVGAPNERCPM